MKNVSKSNKNVSKVSLTLQTNRLLLSVFSSEEEAEDAEDRNDVDAR